MVDARHEIHAVQRGVGELGLEGEIIEEAAGFGTKVAFRPGLSSRSCDAGCCELAWRSQ